MIRLLLIATPLMAVLATAGLPAQAQAQAQTQAQTRDDRFAQPGAMPSFVTRIRGWLASKSTTTSAARPALKPTPAVSPKAVHPEPRQSSRTEPALPAAAPVTLGADVPMRTSSRDTGCSGQRVTAAYYWQGTRTASGAPFDPQGMTAAHRTLPFGTKLTVTNPRTGQSVNVTINDRGPFVHGVAIDLSLGAAKAIGMRGTGAVCLS